MTIKRKNIRPSGLLEVEADNTDTVDTNGFSDAIQAVGAETAKFSGSATMQANPGLRIGMTQLKINTSSTILRIKSIVAGSDIGTTASANMIDGDPVNTFATRSTLGQFAIVDFSSIATTQLTISGINIDSSASAVIKVEIATVASTGPYTDLGNFSFTNPEGQVTKNLGTQTWRFVRLTYISGPTTRSNFRFSDVNEIVSPSTVTVKVRSSTTIDTANGTVIISDQIMNQNETLVFDSDLLLTGNPTGVFVTVEIVSLSDLPIPVTLSEITSIKEVP